MRLKIAFKCRIFLILLAVFLVTVFCYVLGYEDFLYEESFDNFNWAPCVDVRHQVNREINGQRPTVIYQNNWTDQKIISFPKCELNEKNSVLIIVKTAPDRLDRQNAIRNTYGKIVKYGNVTIKTIFVRGKSRTKNFENYAAFLEPVLFKDVLIGDYDDSYHNNTLKFIHSINFVHNYCSNVSYVLLIDDDYMLKIENLVKEVQKHISSEHLYMGWRFDSRPNRNIFNKHWLSLNEYPYNKYPPYITGGAILLSLKSVSEFYYAIQHLKLHKFDDIYVGIIAYELNVMAHHNNNFKVREENPATQSFDDLIAAHGYSAKDLIEQNYRVNSF